MLSSLQSIFALFLLCFTALVSCATIPKVTTGVIVPLYRYPVDSTSWEPLFTAIKANPAVPFTVVINPNSGPGDLNSQPDANYQLYTSQLKACKNVRIIGYVRTDYGNIPSSQVMAEIATYKGWGKAYRPNGIFFDEVADGKFSLYKNYTLYAKKLMANSATLVLNPGTSISAPYFSLATQIVTYESAYADYKYPSLPSGHASQQSVIIHSFPQNDTATLQAVLVPLTRTKRVASVYISDLQISETNVYDGFGGLFDDTASFLSQGR